MEENLFFKPTLLYKEYLILDLIAKDASITQRMMSEALGVSVSLVNGYLDDLEDKAFIKRIHQSKKTVRYEITPDGLKHVKVINIGFLKFSHQIYESAKGNITAFIHGIAEKGFRKVLLYGAGEVASMILTVMNETNGIPVEAIAVIDDNPEKQGNYIINTKIVASNHLNDSNAEGVIISSYSNHDIIYDKLKRRNYPESKILHFFD